MIKVIGLMKRHPDMTPEEFRDYYETKHRLIGEKYLKKHATRYVRRYLTPFADPISGADGERTFDAVIEIWYPDQAAYDATNAQFAEPDVASEIGADSRKMFDVDALRYFLVEEFESDLSK